MKNIQEQFLYLGEGLVINIQEISTIHIHTTDKDGKDCIKVETLNKASWTVYANLVESRRRIKGLFKSRQYFDLLMGIKRDINSKRYRKSYLEQDFVQRINKAI